MTNQAIFEAALSLPPATRAELAEKLVESLEEEQIALDPAWEEEIERRIRDFEEGRTKGIPADEVFRSLKSSDQP